MSDTDFQSMGQEAQRFSKLSIAALLISVLGVLMFCTSLVTEYGMIFAGPGSLDTGSVVFMFVAALMCGGALTSLFGLGLSIGSLFVLQQSKVLSIVGIVLSTVVVCSFATLAAIGMLQGYY